MAGFEGIGDFDSPDPWQRYIAHQAAKGNLEAAAAKPYPKEKQLARGERRYTRQIASPRRWQQIADAKQGICRCCPVLPPNQLHHVVSRAHGGADTEANIVPLCDTCHDQVTRRNKETCKRLVASLTDAEYAYAVDHGGEDFFERAYGLEYTRP